MNKKVILFKFNIMLYICTSFVTSTLVMIGEGGVVKFCGGNFAFKNGSSGLKSRSFPSIFLQETTSLSNSSLYNTNINYNLLYASYTVVTLTRKGDLVKIQ